MTPVCNACDRPLKVGARFCAGCGAFVGRPSQSLPVETPADLGGNGGGLTAALVPFLACLGVSATLLLQKEVGVGDLRVGALVIVGVGVLGTLLWHRANLGLLRPRRLDWRWSIGLVAGAVGLAFGVTQLFGALPDLFVIDETALHKAAGATFALVILDFAILPAIGEELVFRGVILSGLRGAFRDHTAAVISALMFATIHISPLSFVHLALIGYVLARVRLRTKTILPCMVLHAVYNGTVLAIVW